MILAIYVLVITVIVLFVSGMFLGNFKHIPADDDRPDNMYVTAVDTEGHFLSRLSDNYYMDTEGSLYMVNSSGAFRLSDMKPFS